MNRSWSSFLFRKILLMKNCRQQWWNRFKTKSINMASTLKYNEKLMFALASTAGFTFKNHGISDSRIAECKNCKNEFENCKNTENGWELLYEEKNMLAFRRKINGPYEMYEYRCVGTYFDISPRTFLDAQNDLNYRKEWDENIKSIEVIEEEDENELIRWVSKFPYPLYPREYVYVRRTWVSDDEKYAVVDSEAIQPEVFPTSSNENVRVTSYTSRMLIRAHDDWEAHGVDYILTYSDNPEANIPRYIYNWMVNKGGPYFLRQVHAAAKEIEKTGKEVRSATEKAIFQKNERLEKRKRQSEERRKKQQEQREREEEKNRREKAKMATNSIVIQQEHEAKY